MTRVEETFFTAVGCMDGRVQKVIMRFGEEKFRAMYPDTITEAGLVGKLPLKEQLFLEGIKFKVVTVSIGKHGSKGIIIHGHAECAGNPVSDEQQIKDIRASVVVMKEMVGDVSVLGAFVHRDTTDPSHWIVKEV